MYVSQLILCFYCNSFVLQCIGDKNQFLRCPAVYLTGAIGLNVLECHPDFSALYACLQELAPTPRGSYSSDGTTRNSLDDNSRSSSPFPMASPSTIVPPRRRVAAMSLSNTAPIRTSQHITKSSVTTAPSSPVNSPSPSRFAVSLHGHPHASELDESIPVTIVLYLMVGIC
jgi:hypothetical protein